MNQATKDNIKGGIIVGVVANLLFAPIGSYIYDHTKNIALITPILKFFSFIWNDILNYKVSIWILLLLLLIISFIIKKLSSSTIKTEYDEELPEWYTYRKHIFKRWTWVWRYKFNRYKQTYDIEERSQGAHV